jgi:preprotein translocase subunit SecD
VIAAMLPLILSGIVEIEGFGVSAVIGVLVGVIITRPAFGDLMKEIFQKRA